MRALTYVAKAWQESDPTDPSYHTYASNVRVRRAVEILSSYLFIVSENERFAVEDGTLLRSEIGEHDIDLDKVEARAVEARLKYDLAELQAYYATGITTQDIQTLLNFIQTGLLGWIGGKVN
jgi:hypothetical protein